MSLLMVTSIHTGGIMISSATGGGATQALHERLVVRASLIQKRYDAEAAALAQRQVRPLHCRPFHAHFACNFRREPDTVVLKEQKNFICVFARFAPRRVVCVCVCTRTSGRWIEATDFRGVPGSRLRVCTRKRFGVGLCALVFRVFARLPRLYLWLHERAIMQNHTCLCAGAACGCHQGKQGLT